MELAKVSISKEYVDFVFQNLIKAEGLEEGYTIHRLSYLLENNPSLMKDTLSFLEYKEMNMYDFIVADLEDHIDTINSSKEENPEVSFSISITKNDVEYFLKTIERRYKQYLPFIFEENVIIALQHNEKALFTLKAKELKNDDFFQSQLMGHIQYQLVGQTEPAPCAKNSTKQAYYNLFKDLKRRDL